MTDTDPKPRTFEEEDPKYHAWCRRVATLHADELEEPLSPEQVDELFEDAWDAFKDGLTPEDFIGVDGAVEETYVNHLRER